MLGKIPLKATQRRRERHMNDDFGDRLSASANAKTAKLEMAAQAKIAAETPAAIAQRAARATSSGRPPSWRRRSARLRNWRPYTPIGLPLGKSRNLRSGKLSKPKPPVKRH